MTHLPEPGAELALFMDVDGTLIEIAGTPVSVIVPPETIRLLVRLQRGLAGAVALVSGRPIRDLDRLFAPWKFSAAGVHGLQHRMGTGSIVDAAPPAVGLDGARRALSRFSEQTDGTVLEDKGVALAVHYRNAPEQGETVKALAREWADRLGAGFHVLEGKMVVEIKPSGLNKGAVVEHFMAKSPFAGRRPVFVGDDLTDEDGFKAVNAAHGYSIRVGGANQTAARFRSPSVAVLLAWLDEVAVLAEASRSTPSNDG